MVLDLISRLRELRNLPNRHTGLRSLSSHCFADKQATRKPRLVCLSDFFIEALGRLFQAQQRAIEDEIDNVARRFEQPQPVREPKFIGKRDRIVGRRNYLTPQGSNSRSTNCS